MTPATIPENEIQRLKLLYELQILDTSPEEIYDDLIQFAAEICQLDIAVLSLVDEKRQWFKSKVGLEVCETDRSISFCSHAILADEPLIVSDALKDPRFFDNPLVCEEPRIRFYAGFPLIFEKKLRLGTLCVIGQKPQQLDALQIKTLKLLSKQIVALLQNHMRETQRQHLQKLIEEQEVKALAASKLAVLGEMSAGIAHEINNPLAIILANSAELIHMAKQETINKDELKNIGECVEKISLRLARTVAALRSFSRDGESVKMEVCHLNSIFSDTLEICRQKFHDYGIEFRFDYPDSSVDLYCRSVEVSQVLLNLFNNAIDAVQGTKLKIIDCETKVLSDFVEISVTNTGPIIPVELREKIMNPFFTTKPAGKGTGLGLSISQRIASLHGGSLVLDDSSKLTRFVLRLPIKT